ncbi:unnamed protein product [Moneuplotes crassus]|uniref:Trichohyalin-plectin-homology domain-containing protein n=1 Tax=Euplotes crassus TaxID=5936 RepID=A0AAD1UA79_EUPCR|nr:unnamed protein product [Moneuplotes crassus]
MYPKKKSVSMVLKREQDKLHRREQMKVLLINKFRVKYSLGSKDKEERDKIISKEVNSLVDSKICTDKQLVALDKKLTGLFGTRNKISKPHSSQNSRHSRASAALDHTQSALPNINAFSKAEAGLISHKNSMKKPLHCINSSANLNGHTVGLNNAEGGLKALDEWGIIIMDDVKRFEREEKQILENRRKIKQKIMDDLNKQVKEKEALKKKQKQEEIDLEKKRQSIFRQQEKREKQNELLKRMKRDEERKIMDTQIAEIENYKKIEMYHEKLQADHEKEQALKELEEDLESQKMKRKAYIEGCQKQYQENLQLKEFMRQKEADLKRQATFKQHQLFDGMFEQKKHISYELADRNQKKYDALSRILKLENERKQRARNYLEPKTGGTDIEKKTQKESQKRKLKHQEDVKETLDYLKGQIRYKEQKKRLEKDAKFDTGVSTMMNGRNNSQNIVLDNTSLMKLKAREFLAKEAKKETLQTQKIEYKRDFRNQGLGRKKGPFGAQGYQGMTEQERLMNKKRLDAIL